jgi:hypothetical protein
MRASHSELFFSNNSYSSLKHNMSVKEAAAEINFERGEK